MRERLRIFLLLTAFWLSYMIIARMIFLGYNYELSSNLTISEIMLAMLYGLRMDASMAGYFLAAYGLLLSISAVRNAMWIPRAMNILTITLLIFCTLVVVVDIELYQHWGFRLNTTPFLYIGKEAMATIPLSVYASEAVIFLGLFSAFALIFRKKIYPFIRYMGETQPKKAVLLFFLSALTFLPIRGSFTVAPMNPGFVYFHNSKPYANHAAVNVIWTFIRSFKGSAIKYPNDFFDSARTSELFNDLYADQGQTKPLLKTDRPNIILVILESFTADVVEPLGGVSGITPYLNELCGEGVLFDSIYASGDRTDKGLISILSGFPAQPQTSIIKYPAKSQRLPLLTQELRSIGYRTSFIYGGDIDFAYFRSYLNTSGFDHITELDDFDQDLYTSKWGVHDHYMFEKAMTELDTTKGPFFKVILTLSSHEPFDVPAKPIIEKNDPESLFLNSCHYTDESLARFIRYCKKQQWWDNTIVLLVADHGHRFPRDKELPDKERFRIPLLIVGGAIRKDTVIHTTGSQTDIAATLLQQLNVKAEKFTYSKNLASPNAKPFAAYFFNDGYGFVTPRCYIVYDNQGRRFLRQDGAEPLDIDISRAYQQHLYSDFNTMENTKP
jgi:phosphoglycerol transferase MdoB-like AlkP superfamily enzyme